MAALKVLHLASFSGNIGDNANHNGFRRLLCETLDTGLACTDLEIREFYWKERRFDADFVALCNAHDLVVIGGGNYFELWVPDSATGTSIDIAPDILAAIQTPVVFNALGVDVGQGLPKGNAAKFRGFLDTLLGSDQFVVSVRNDGARDSLREHIGASYAEAVHLVADGGFFVTTRPAFQGLVPGGAVTIGINLAGDLPDLRFGGDRHAFAQQLADGLTALMGGREEIHLLLFAHIFRDFDPLHALLDALPDPLRRRRVAVAPYVMGQGAECGFFDLYRRCAAVLGMRFHANVCPIGLGVPTVGLSTYPQIDRLYRELGLDERVVDVTTPDFATELVAKTRSSLADSERIGARYQQISRDLEAGTREFHAHIGAWLGLDLRARPTSMEAAG